VDKRQSPGRPWPCSAMEPSPADSRYMCIHAGSKVGSAVASYPGPSALWEGPGYEARSAANLRAQALQSPCPNGYQQTEAQTGHVEDPVPCDITAGRA